LFVAFPPHLPNNLQPVCNASKSSDQLTGDQSLKLETDAMISLLFLGSDGAIRMKKAGKGKSGEITVQHGDVVGVTTGDESIELFPKFDGFGFCEHSG
jgi:hypothetical protein